MFFFPACQNKLSSSREILYDFHNKLLVHPFKSEFICVEHKDFDLYAAFQRCRESPIW